MCQNLWAGALSYNKLTWCSRGVNVLLTDPVGLVGEKGLLTLWHQQLPLRIDPTDVSYYVHFTNFLMLYTLHSIS